MKTVLYFVFSVFFSCLTIGIYLDFFAETNIWKDRAYGISAITLFFVWMPLFLFSRKDKTNFLRPKSENEYDED